MTRERLHPVGAGGVAIFTAWLFGVASGAGLMLIALVWGR